MFPPAVQDPCPSHHPRRPITPVTPSLARHSSHGHPSHIYNIVLNILCRYKMIVTTGNERERDRENGEVYIFTTEHLMYILPLTHTGSRTPKAWPQRQITKFVKAPPSLASFCSLFHTSIHVDRRKCACCFLYYLNLRKYVWRIFTKINIAFLT